MTGADPRVSTFVTRPGQDIGGTAARGGAATLLANAAAQVIRLAATLVMAHLLLPAEFGLFAMVVSAIGVAGVLRDMGLSSATIQSPTLTERQVSTVFWINAALGTLATLAMVSASPWIASGLGVPKAKLLIAALAPTFLLGGLATQHRALLSRKLAFITQARMTLSAMLISQTLALLLAVCGAGVWALISGVLITELTVTIWCWTVEPWRPKREFAFTEVRSFLVFGGYTSVFSILAYLGSNLHQLMIGIASGPEAAGYFNRAFILVLAPVSLILAPVGGVITAALSRVQSDPPAFLRYYLNSMAAVNLMSAPLGCYSLVFAPELVRLLLGTSWAESGILLRLMAISILVQPLMYSSGWVYQSRGEVRRMFWWGNVGWGVILAMYLVGLAWGARGVAAAHSVALMFLIWPCLHFAYRGTMITTQNTLRVCTPALMAAVIAAVPAWGIREMLPNHSALIILIAGSTVYAGSYIGLLFALGETPRLIQLWGHLRPGAFA